MNVKPNVHAMNVKFSEIDKSFQIVKMKASNDGVGLGAPE
jgi:hypothetical protein